MVSFWNAVNKVIEQADILLIVVDARIAEETVNTEVENKIKKTKKPYFYVITKCDLITQRKAEMLKKEIRPSIFISSKEYHGLKKLREQIIITGKKNYSEKQSYVVGVLGYPNVGKSSLINALNGRSSAGVSSTSGFTKGIQKIRSDNKILFLDSPGVIPYKEKDALKHSIIGTIDYNRAKDLDLVIYKLFDTFPGIIERHYDLDTDLEEDEKIEIIAKKNNMYKKGGIPDIERASRKILKDWQEGKIKSTK